MEVEPDSNPVRPHRISCSNIPVEFADKHIAKSHFQQFGHIIKILFRPKTRSCFIEYDNEDSVRRALLFGGQFKDKLFTVQRSAKTSPKKRKSKKEEDSLWLPDPAVQAELEAMGGFTPKKKYKLRPEAMQVDRPTPPKRSSKLKKISRLWKAQESSPEVEVDAPLPPTSKQLELLNLVKQSALTLEEKYKVLDARDKLLRLSTKRQTDLLKVGHIVGTCPDMCPEKERLMREIQHQVAVYEQEAGGKAMNHSLAVKQYSRSSADQEVPLPHELRPVGVLQLTMGYLMHRIMELCDFPEVNLGEWYHFLWDRTRGIRKDMTQQALCSQGSVTLVEQCARFHIHCSARLVAEDPSVFDHKINTENLTKCLQTLKYMYHDLELNGETCRNEAEFRTYIILLNLNDGNFMWEVQKLKDVIQKSPEVKFALEVYSSIDKNNYIKFFKLVHRTTYLNACILLRYFIQVRIRALSTILKCYSPRAPYTLFPLSQLSNLLAFENTYACHDFLQYHGLFLNSDQTHVVLDRKSFELPKLPYTLDRAIDVIESKRDCSVGEIICGDPLPPPIFINHVPNNSFDEDGYLKNISEFSEFEQKEREVKQPEPKLPKKIEPEKPEPEKPKELKKIYINPIFPPSKILPEFHKEASIVGGTEPTKSSTIFGKDTVDKPEIKPFWPTEATVFAKPIASPPKPIEVPKPVPKFPKIDLEEIRKKEEARKLKERLKVLEEENNRRELEARRKQLELQKELERRKKEERERLEADRIRRNDVKVLLDDLLSRVEEVYRKDRLKVISENIERRKANFVVEKWRRMVARNKQKRCNMEHSPIWIPSRTINEEAKELFTENQELTLRYMKRYRYGKPLELSIPEEKPIEKIQLHQLVYNVLVNSYAALDPRLQQDIFWKIDISLPENVSRIDEILNEFLCWKSKNKSTVLIEQFRPFGIHLATYCLQRNVGSPKGDWNGLIFISEKNDEILYDRVYNSLWNLGKSVRFPIVLIVESGDFVNSISGVSNLKIISGNFSSTNLTRFIEDALVFLAKNVTAPPPLNLDTLNSFLSKTVTDDLIKRIQSFAKWNFDYKTALKKPNVAIHLFNEACLKLEKVIFDQGNYEYSNFPEIFQEYLRNEIPDFLPCDYRYFPKFWKTEDYKYMLRDAIENLQLPLYSKQWPPKDLAELEKNVFDYCREVFANPERVFYKIMAVVLKNFDPVKDFIQVDTVSWLDVTELMVVEKLKEINFNLPMKSIFNQLFVVYDVGQMNKFQTSSWFYVNNVVVKAAMHANPPVLEEVIESCCSDFQMDIDLDKTLNDLLKTPVKKNERVAANKEELERFKSLMADLEESMEIEKQIFCKFQDTIKTALDFK